MNKSYGQLPLNIKTGYRIEVVFADETGSDDLAFTMGVHGFNGVDTYLEQWEKGLPMETDSGFNAQFAVEFRVYAENWAYYTPDDTFKRHTISSTLVYANRRRHQDGSLKILKGDIIKTTKDKQGMQKIGTVVNIAYFGNTILYTVDFNDGGDTVIPETQVDVVLVNTPDIIGLTELKRVDKELV